MRNIEHPILNRRGKRIAAWGDLSERGVYAVVSGKAALKTHAPNASRPPGVPEPREASGVRPIYRRFLRRAGVPRLMVRMNLPG